uniref:Uncharacterized protein n=1 Tax=Neovison vison TaxID=452646 RepID=A0A8C7BJW7_NEOVI
CQLAGAALEALVFLAKPFQNTSQAPSGSNANNHVCCRSYFQKPLPYPRVR